jgi:hypothetical protein
MNAFLLLLLFLVATPAAAVPITQSQIYIYNVEGTTDFSFAIIEGASHHAFLWDIGNGYSIENATYDWLVIGDYLCLAGQRCVVSGEGLRFVDFYFVTLTTPTIDFWGHPAVATADGDDLVVAVAGLVLAAAFFRTRFHRLRI